MEKIKVLFFIFFIIGLIYSQEYKIIINSSNSETTITRKKAASYFLKKSKKWSNGTKVLPIDHLCSARKSFSKNIIGKTISAVESYWQQKLFSGSDTPPIKVKTDAEAVDYVKNNPGAIAYVTISAKLDGVKEFKIE